MSLSLSLFVSSLFLAFVRCFSMAINMLRLIICCNDIDGVAVWWMSPYESLDNSLHLELTQCRRCRGESVPNVYALKASLFVLDRSASLFHGDLVGGNCASGIARDSWAVYPVLPKWLIGIGMRA